MTFDDGIRLLKKQLKQPLRNSEKKYARNFIAALVDLKEKNFGTEDMASIEKELDQLLFFDPTGEIKKPIQKAFRAFSEFLKNSFGLTSEGHFTSTWMLYGIMFGPGIGLAFGSAFGSGLGVSLGLSMGMSIGMAIGIAFGASKDAEAKKRGKTFRTKWNPTL